MGSPMTLSHLTLSDLEGQFQGYSDFEALNLARLILLLNIDRKAYMGSPMTSSHMTFGADPGRLHFLISNKNIQAIHLDFPSFYCH